MGKKRRSRFLLLSGSILGAALFLITTAGLFGPIVRAEDLKSTTYTLKEGAIGSGSLNQSASSTYRITDATGDIGIGTSNSSTYNLTAGSKTTPDPTLSFSITNSGSNFPSFSASSASMTTATFSVLNYTSYGYVVQIAGNAPTNGTKVIPGLATNSDSQPGTEQFGLNLVANTVPSSIGANPDNGGYGFGQADPNYAIPNKYRFVSGDTIARAPKSSGVTNYTISYLVNVAGLTPGGQYQTNLTLIVVGTY